MLEWHYLFSKTDRTAIVDMLEGTGRAIARAIARRALRGPDAWPDENAAMTRMRARRAQLEAALDSIDSPVAAA